jgi:hypothetical protein
MPPGDARPQRPQDRIASGERAGPTRHDRRSCLARSRDVSPSERRRHVDRFRARAGVAHAPDSCGSFQAQRVQEADSDTAGVAAPATDRSPILENVVSGGGRRGLDLVRLAPGREARSQLSRRLRPPQNHATAKSLGEHAHDAATCQKHTFSPE